MIALGVKSTQRGTGELEKQRARDFRSVDLYVWT